MARPSVFKRDQQAPPLCKGFGRAFSKAREVEGAKPSSRSAERENPTTAFLFGKLAGRFAASLRAFSYFLCACGIKEKAAEELEQVPPCVKIVGLV
jgi:hypothetical protein